MEQELQQQYNEIAEIACKSQSTIKNYWRYIRQYTDYYGKKPDQKCMIKHLYYLRTIKRYDKSSMIVARSALKYYHEEILCEDITIKLPPIKRRKSIPNPLPKQTIKDIISGITNLKHRLLVEMAYDGGLRPFELVSLQWEDIDWQNQTIRVNRGKGDKDRVIYLSNTVLQHLQDHKNIRDKENENCRYIFYSEYRKDNHITKRTYEKILENTSKKLNLETNIYPYRIRHSFATHLRDSGVPIEEIQPRMGHSNIRTTMIYTKVETPKEKPLTLMDDEYFKHKEIMRNNA